MDPRRRTGILLVGIGSLFLLGQLGLGPSWPLFVLVPGLLMLATALSGPREASGLAIPGSIVSTVGLILLVQALTDRFDTWSYAWALVLAAVGVGIFLHGTIDERPEGQREGVRVATLGLTLFAAFGVLFEFLVLGPRGGGAGGWLLPLALIVAGAWMLRRRAA